MPREHQRQQLVSQLHVGELLALFGGRVEEQRQHVATALGIAARRDNRVDVPVEVGEHGAQEAHWLLAVAVDELRDLRLGAGREREDHPDGAAQALLVGTPLRAALDPEDPRHDHVEGDGLHSWGERKGGAHRPAVDLPPATASIIST